VRVLSVILVVNYDLMLRVWMTISADFFTYRYRVRCTESMLVFKVCTDPRRYFCVIMCVYVWRFYCFITAASHIDVSLRIDSLRRFTDAQSTHQLTGRLWNSLTNKVFIQLTNSVAPMWAWDRCRCPSRSWPRVVISDWTRLVLFCCVFVVHVSGLCLVWVLCLYFSFVFCPVFSSMNQSEWHWLASLCWCAIKNLLAY